jgi:hypothetical protein
MTTITVDEIKNLIQGSTFPNDYPSYNFRKEHIDIIKPFMKEISMYKGNCYHAINNYYRTGTFSDSHCPVLKNYPGDTVKDKLTNVLTKLESLYDLVKPLPNDIVVYRGINNGLIGRNLFTGDCIKTRQYDRKKLCQDHHLADFKLFEKFVDSNNAKDFVYEIVGFGSTTTRIGTAINFARNNTVIALRLPAGSKFIMPIEDLNIPDMESELILFPGHNTFVLYSATDISVPSLTYNPGSPNVVIPLYLGSICNEINSLLTQKPQIKVLPYLNKTTTKKIKDPIFNNKKLLKAEFSHCDTSVCLETGKFCHPTINKCLEENESNVKLYKKWWVEKTTEGKCTEEKAKKCVDKYTVCNKLSGRCISKIPKV